MGSQRFFRNHLRAIHDALTLNQFCHQRLKSNFVVISVCRVLPVEILVQGLRQIHQKPECACSLALGGGHWHNGPNSHHFFAYSGKNSRDDRLDDEQWRGLRPQDQWT